MKWSTIMYGVLFLIAGFGFLFSGGLLQPKTSIHEIFQMLYYICSVLCFGFMALLLKESK